MTTYDAIVLGTGGVGSAAVYHLAQRGMRVLGLDRFEAAHDRGSSHGQTRIIRQAYFEHPDYVPLLKRAYQLWSDLQQRRGEQLYHQVGLLEVGPADGVVIPGVKESARRYQLEVDSLNSRELAERLPGFHLPPGYEAVFERNAGYLMVERCILAHLEEAQQLGAELRTGESVVSWRAEQGGVTLRTDAGEYSAAKLVITAGAWAGDMLGELGVELSVVRKHLHWFDCDRSKYHRDSGCPTFFYETPAGYYYGFPQIDRDGLKVAEHSGGTAVEDPLQDDRSQEEDEQRRIQQFLEVHLPGVSLEQKKHAVCFYTRTDDEHFIVDRHPLHDQVVFAAGLSGHGFKFAGVLGEVLADLAMEGKTSQSIEFLRCGRFV